MPKFLVDYDAAVVKMRATPASLTDAEISAIELIDTREAASAREARQAARHPPPVITKAETPPAPVRRAVESVVRSTDGDPNSLDELIELYESTAAEPIAGADFALLLGFIDQMNQKNMARNQRLAALEQQVHDLSERPAALKYAGAWTPRSFEKDEACTRDGGLWIARRQTKATERPGDDSGAFQLAVKSGGGAR